MLAVLARWNGEMTIFLHDIWPIKDVEAYKVHFARWNGEVQPLEVWARDKQECGQGLAGISTGTR